MPDANTLTADEQAAGFRLLFDGKTTDGWRGYQQDTAYPQWQITGDALQFHPGDQPEYGHDIITVDTFTRFELRLQWKLWKGGNSGVFYHVREVTPQAYESGPEYQLLDNDNHPDAKNGPERLAGACYGLYAPLATALRPVGEWNDLTLLVDGDHVTHRMNGTLMADYTLGSADWDRRVAASKFKEWPHFAAQRRGHLMLQDHRDPVAFRNIRLRTF